jgi:hypothetical protein
VKEEEIGLIDDVPAKHKFSLITLVSAKVDRLPNERGAVKHIR